MSKRKRFDLPYFGFDNKEGDFHIIYGKRGEASVVFKITNNIVQYSADPELYENFHNSLLSVVKIVGEGHFVQKLDIFSNNEFFEEISEEYLQKAYDKHFNGRIYRSIITYLVITRKPRTSTYIYNKAADDEFRRKLTKVEQALSEAKFRPVPLKDFEIDEVVRRTLMMDFVSPVISMDNLMTANSHLTIGERRIKSISLVDIDRVDLPEVVSPYLEKNDQSSMRGFPVDTMGFLHSIKGYETLIYNQVIDIPYQTKVLQKLELKQNRHEAIPDPQNTFSAQDISNLLADVARESQLIVNAHFNIVVSAKPDDLTRTVNSIENALFAQKITINHNGYNQLELFRSILVGNAVELKEYDWFMTTSDAALCFFFKEALPVSDSSQFFLRFTDRQGIPIKIDPSDLPKETGRIDNRNKFVLGPSGSGKSFVMNAFVEQYMLYNYDIVIVDTGDSYSGTCSYYKGKYITYTEEKPITMNPFKMNREEYNLEKKDFLITLTGLLWKGADGNLSQVERDVLTNVVTSYYDNFFNQKDRNWSEALTIFQMENFLKDYGISTNLLLESARLKLIGSKNDVSDHYSVLKVDRLASQEEIKRQFRKLSILYHPDVSTNENIVESTDLFIALKKAYEVLSDEDKREEYDRIIKVDQLSKELFEGHYENAEDTDLMKLYREELLKRIDDLLEELKISRLCFDTFYEYSQRRIPTIIEKAHIHFDFDEYIFVLEKFYKGGEFDMILNEDADKSLFDERFIVFEIDNIKEHKILFPIVTLIIMDVFIQKMRLRKYQRKALIIEEAWKAIASPMMGNYIKYLYKTVRKFYGEAIVVTQELKDIIGNEVVKDSIISNSDSMLLLDQRKFKDNFDEISDLLGFNEVDRRKIFTINRLENKEGRGRFKEFYFRIGDRGDVYGNEVSLLQYLTYTTEKPEKNAVETYTKYFGSYPGGLDKFVVSLKKSTFELPLFVQFVNLYGDVLSDEVLNEIIKLEKEHRSNTLNWIKRKLSAQEISFKSFIDNKIIKYEEVNF